MTRWITFDQTTADGLRARVPAESVFEFPGRSLMEYVLSSPQNVVGVLDTGVENQCAVAVFQRGSEQQEQAAPVPRFTRATGILGLGDETVFEEEETPQPKSWWRRVWED
jgi:hypothetical protein